MWIFTGLPDAAGAYNLRLQHSAPNKDMIGACFVSDDISEDSASDEELTQCVKDLMDMLSPHVAMIGFAEERTGSASDIVANGTVSLLHLPGRKVMLTNHHVWDHFRNLSTNKPKARAYLFGHGFLEPIDVSTATIVGESVESDLIVLRCDSDRIETLGLKFHMPPIWLPRRAEPGDYLVFAGYPGERR